MSSTVVNVGSPPPDSGFNLKEYNATVHVHNFKNRSVNSMITSPKFSCAGREWVLVINPKHSVHGDVEIYLKSQFQSTITVWIMIYRSGVTRYVPIPV
eukprot:scaffold30656_cov62-Cyclotella_meneghiniana.AAC.2